MSRRVLIYKRFERFWHWTQAALIILLALTGFEIHGSYRLLGFERAIAVHDVAAVALLVLVAFAIFWHFTTGEWRQYVPTGEKLREMLGYYLGGIFRGEPHPVHKSEISKLNPLQRVTYAGLKILIIPLQLVSGLAYYFYNDLVEAGYLTGGVGPVAVVHVAGSFALIVFLIAHIYLTTTGTTPTSNIKAMVTGWEQLEDEEEGTAGEPRPGADAPG